MDARAHSWDTVEKIMSITTVLGAVAAGIAVRFTGSTWDRALLTATASCVFLLAATEAFKRYRSMDRIDRNIMQTLSKVIELHGAVSTSIKPLMGSGAVYQEVTKLLEACTGSEIIRTTSLTVLASDSDKDKDESPPDSPELARYLEAMAQTIAAKKGTGMSYRCVMGFRLDRSGSPPPNKKRAISKRRAVFSKHNVLSNMKLKYLNSSWALDMIIVDDGDVVLGFPTVAGSTEIRLGVRISGKGLLKEVIRWYDDYLWQPSKDIVWTEET